MALSRLSVPHVLRVRNTVTDSDTKTVCGWKLHVHGLPLPAVHRWMRRGAATERKPIQYPQHATMVLREETMPATESLAELRVRIETLSLNLLARVVAA